MLANDGMYTPVRYQDDDTALEGTPLQSPEAAFMVRSILADAPRPDGLVTPQQPVMWKTGTSWGFRDAWTAGLFGDWILVVWVGNFDGSSNPAFVGVQAAAPLFFRNADTQHHDEDHRLDERYPALTATGHSRSPRSRSPSCRQRLPSPRRWAGRGH
jgi:membrane carboxypeptidase/penicillin-binding protein PbpC